MLLGLDLDRFTIAQVEPDGAREHLGSNLGLVCRRLNKLLNLPRLLIHTEHVSELREDHAQLIVSIHVIILLDEVNEHLDALLLRFNFTLQVVVLAHKLHVAHVAELFDALLVAEAVQ